MANTPDLAAGSHDPVDDDVARRDLLRAGGAVAGVAAAVVWGLPRVETLALRPSADNARFIGSPGPTGTTLRPPNPTSATTTPGGTDPGDDPGNNPGSTGGLDALPLTGADPRRLTVLGAALVGAGAWLQRFSDRGPQPSPTSTPDD